MIKRKRRTRRFTAERARTLGADSVLGSGSGLRLDWLIVVLAALLVAALLVGLGRSTAGQTLAACGTALAVMGLGSVYLLRYQRERLVELRKLVTLISIALLVLVVARVARSGPPYVSSLIPLPLAGLLFTIVFGPRLAIEVTALLGVLCALTIAPGDSQQSLDLAEVLVVLASGSVLGSLAATQVRKRSTLVCVGFLVGFLMAGMRLLLDVQRTGMAGGDLVLQLGITMGHGIVSGFLLTGILPAIESLTGTVTDIRLLELSNQNEQPLLRRLLLMAPGTHHHSFVVGTLAESAAEAVSANALLCRVGAYYHDIGKMNKPGYFSENSPEARNKHADLSPEMSTLVITAHPKDGIELADYYGLPEALKVFIAEHHGTTAVEYFYQKAVEQRGDVARDAYRYAGPRPQSKETAIMMLADSVEASSRTLREPTPARLEGLIDEIVKMKMDDGQLDDCNLTMRDLTRIKEAFLQVLLGIYHFRPTYPRTLAGETPPPEETARRTAPPASQTPGA